MFPSNTKFLVVDDFATMRKAVKRVLTELSYDNVVEAADGQAAIQVLEDCVKEKAPVQFIICDWNMPNMNGIKFLEYCRSNPAYKDILFMMVTAEGEQGQIVEAIKLGVSEYVLKPFSPATMRQKIEKIYQKSDFNQKSQKVS